MVPWLRVLGVLAEELSSVPSTYARWLSQLVTPTPWESDALFWPPRAPALMCTYPHADMHIIKKTK